MNASDKKHLIVFLVDHASPDAFFSMIDAGKAPYVTKYILGEKTEKGTYSKAAISRNITTGYPSTSANSHTSLITGSFAGKNEMLYTVYWDCTGKKPIYVDTEAISLTLLRDMNEKFMSHDCKTIFEHIPDSASFHGLNRGASFKLLTTFTLLTKFFPLLQKMKKKDDPYAINPMAEPELWRTMFLGNLSGFLQRVKKSGHLYEAAYIVFLLSDENAHKFGFGSEKYEEAVSVLDFFVQCMVEGLEDPKLGHVEGLKEMGYLDSIVWCINTDHAGRPIEKEKFIAASSIMDIELGIKTIEGIEEHSDQVLKSLKGDLSKVNAFITVGSELMHGWFGPRDSKLAKDFSNYYGESFFREIFPKSKPRSAKYASLEKIDLIDYFLNHDYTQFVIIPEESPNNYNKGIPSAERVKRTIPREYTIKICSKEGIGEVIRSEKEGEICYSYKVNSGKDPLYYENIGIPYKTPESHRVWLEKTIAHELPDVFHRLYGFFDCIYAPNFLLTSAFDYHFWSLWEVKKKLKKKLLDVQSHDGLYGVESIVPLTIAGPGVKKGFEIPIGRNIDILPTLLEIMGKPYDPAIIDGKPLREVLEK